MIARLGLMCLFAMAGVAQMLPQPELLRLGAIKRKIREHLSLMPNYTCLETVERYHHLPDRKRESLVDVVRLEVALVEGREMFAWPGAGKFEAFDIREVVSTGAFSNGSFALHARAIFVSEVAVFQNVAAVELDGVKAWRYDYYTPLFRSGYELRSSGRGAATVGYHGSIWARDDNNELLRVTVVADDIPETLGIVAAQDQLNYQVAKIGERQALLPLESEVRLKDVSGVESINRTRLSRCKQYSGESTLKFDEVSETAAGPAKVKKELVLEPYTEVVLALERELNHEEFAVGDQITARLVEPIKDGKKVLGERGALATGRILRLEHEDREWSIYNVTLEFTEIEGEEWVARPRLRLMTTDPNLGLPPIPSGRGSQMVRYVTPRTDPNGFIVRQNRLKLKPGFRLIWQTQK